MNPPTHARLETLEIIASFLLDYKEYFTAAF